LAATLLPDEDDFFVGAELDAPPRYDVTFLNSLSNMEREINRPVLRNARMAMWILATPAKKPARVKTKSKPMTPRTKGRSMTPPPGCITWLIKLDILLY
jgi:hypothetical protein